MMLEAYAAEQSDCGAPHAGRRWITLREPEAPYGPLKPRLLDQVRDAIRTRHMSYRTEEAYVHWIKRYILFHQKRHPSEMGPAEITRFLTCLAVERRVSASTQNQALAALLFLYREVLGCDPGWLDGIVRAKRPRRLPVVLTRPEVTALLGALRGTNWIMAMLLFGAGLRLSECLRLRVKDVDFSRNEILVRQGKGDKDRVTMLPSSVKEALAAHLVRVRRLHERDMTAGFGRVQLPDALARKYPNANRDWGWQWVFPASKICRDVRFGEPQRFTSTPRSCRRRFARRRRQPGLRSRSVRTRCAIVLRPTCSQRATTYGPSKSCSAIRM